MSTTGIWAVILAIGIGTFLIRFSFLGLIGGRALPDRALRLLRYTPFAVLPALVAPLAVWPAATGGAPDLARMVAAGVTIALGLALRNVIAAVLGGAAALYLSLYLVG